MKKILLFLGLLLLVLTPLTTRLSNIAYGQDGDDEEEEVLCILYVESAPVQMEPNYDSIRVDSPGSGQVVAIGKEGQWYAVVYTYGNGGFIFGYMHEYSAYRTEGECENFLTQPFFDDGIIIGTQTLLDCRIGSGNCTPYEFDEEVVAEMRATQCLELEGEEIGPGCGDTVAEEVVACSTEPVPTANQLVNVACGGLEFTAPADNVIISSDFAIVLDYGSMVVMLTQREINLACEFDCAVSASSVEVDDETYDFDFLQAVEMEDEVAVFTYLED